MVEINWCQYEFGQHIISGYMTSIYVRRGFYKRVLTLVPHRNRSGDVFDFLEVTVTFPPMRERICVLHICSFLYNKMNKTTPAVGDASFIERWPILPFDRMRFDPEFMVRYKVMQTCRSWKSPILFSLCAVIVVIIPQLVQMKWNIQAKSRQSIKAPASALSSHLLQPYGDVRHFTAERLITEC